MRDLLHRRSARRIIEVQTDAVGRSAKTRVGCATVNDRHNFEARIVPHLDAAYNLARWLLRDPRNAEDAVQEAAIRALRYFDTLREGDARPWFLCIVRNTCFTALQRSRSDPDTVEFNAESLQSDESDDERASPEHGLQQQHMRRRVDAAIRALPPPLREVIVLREFEGLEYAQIAHVASVPIGTVMSRLARAREKLRSALSPGAPGAERRAQGSKPRCYTKP